MPRTHRAKKPDASPCPVKTDDEMIDLWLYGRSLNTQANYRRDIGRLLDFADKPLSDLTLVDLQAFDRSESAAGAAAATRYRRLSAIRSLFEFAFRSGYVPFDASASLLLPKVPDTLAERILSVEEVGRLFRVLANRCRAVNLSDGWYSARELAAAMSVSAHSVWKAATAQGWPSKIESREVGCGRRRTYIYAWETVRSWLAPVVLGPGWYTARELAEAKKWKNISNVRKVAVKRHWPYRVVIQERKTYKMAKLYPSDCARRLEALSRALREYALVSLLYFGGLRISEALSVRWESFREAKGGGALVTVFGKGGKTRTVRLPMQAWTAIRRIRGDAGAGAVVFWGQSPAKPLSREHTTRFLKVLAREANVSDRLSPHWFRHSHATHALENGAPIHLVQATLGHSSLMSTERYLHANPECGSGEYLPDPTAPAAVGAAWLAAKRAAVIAPVRAGRSAG